MGSSMSEDPPAARLVAVRRSDSTVHRGSRVSRLVDATPLLVNKSNARATSPSPINRVITNLGS